MMYSTQKSDDIDHTTSYYSIQDDEMNSNIISFQVFFKNYS